MTRHAVAAAITSATLTVTGAIFLRLDPYHVGVMAGVTMMCCAWALVEAIQHAGECGPRYDQALYPERGAPPVRPTPARSVRVVCLERPPQRSLPAPARDEYDELHIDYAAEREAAARERRRLEQQWAEYVAMEKDSAADAAYYARVDADSGEWEDWEETE